MSWKAPEVFTSVQGNTVFTIPDFSLFSEAVYLNGIKKVYNVHYLVSQTGSGDLFNTITLLTPVADDSDIVEINVYDEDTSISSKLDSLLTAAIGSWSWNKREGRLSMFSEDHSGDPSFVFDVSDNAEEAIRERRADLEV